MRSSSGAGLLDGEGLRLLRSELVPIARGGHAEFGGGSRALGARGRRLFEDAEAAARAILGLGAEVVVVHPGGNLSGLPTISSSIGGERFRLPGRRARGGGAHGTGCVFLRRRSRRTWPRLRALGGGSLRQTLGGARSPLGLEGTIGRSFDEFRAPPIGSFPTEPGLR